MFAAAGAQAGAPQPALGLSLTTDRGCAEDGQNPVFAVGERISVTFRIGSDSVPRANATLFDVAANGVATAISFGALSTNRTFSFVARIAPPAGMERLILRAEAEGVATQRRTCSFTVVTDRTPVATASPTPTRTPRSPTATRTPRTMQPTRTLGGDLVAQIRTNRGCREDGDEATFAIGAPIVISLRIGSDNLSRASATIVDSLPNGNQIAFSLGLVPTNIPFALVGQVGPPSGVHALRLRAVAPGVQAQDTCSFLVAGGPPLSKTRTATRTATVLKTATPTPPFTPTPMPDGPCVGACTQDDAVSVGDLLTVIEIAAGKTPLSACPVADANGDQQVTLDEVMLAVNNAIEGCP